MDDGGLQAAVLALALGVDYASHACQDGICLFERQPVGEVRR